MVTKKIEPGLVEVENRPNDIVGIPKQKLVMEACRAKRTPDTKNFEISVL